MTRITLIRYGAYHQCSEDLHPLHSLGGEQIRNIAKRLKETLIGIKKDDITCISSNFRPAWESLHMLIKQLFGNQFKPQIDKLKHWTLPNSNAAPDVLREYLDYSYYKANHTTFDQLILNDIENCKSSDLVCGVHGRTMMMILEHFKLKIDAQIPTKYDRRREYKTVNNGQVIVIDLSTKQLLGSFTPSGIDYDMD